ncbi:hypothetical protein [Akkermansia muciniphila]|uniref:hypothetical protein n=1 Tax=Akkermansia muciniphila TaxID=239935 RepID=UPI00236641D2|nr:hypothetical protein [Akkermansia muciniphila]
MKFPDAMTTPPVPASPEKSRIPVMFSATGGWGLPLGVAIHTLCLHAGPDAFMTFTSFTTEWTRE